MYDFKPPYHGSAYYPESWPREQIDEDLDIMLAHGLNTVRVAEFAWSTMEPEEGKYDFSLFREMVDKCRARGISVVMCTPSATPPAWMEVNYPEIMMEIDTMKATHGSRRLSCPSSPRFRAFCAKICHEMGKEFGKDENIIGWQIDNELTALTRDKGCTCPSCTQSFRRYLERRYGTIENLNKAWKHNTWSMDFQSFDQIDPPDDIATPPPSHKMAWAEYKSWEYADFCKAQADILRLYTKAPIGTDMMPTQQLDYELTNESLEVAQFNHYSGPYSVTHYLDFLRTLKERPFWVTETSCCWNGGLIPQGARVRHFAIANSLVTFALGGEMVSYWLFRDHLGGHEQMHGSVVDSWGRERHMADEVRYVSQALDKLRPALEGTRVSQRELAVVWPHTSFWMSRYNPMHFASNEHLQFSAHAWLSDSHFRPDVIGAGADLSGYKLIVSPQQYTIEEKGFDERILAWVKAGGTWVVGPLSDVQTPDSNKYANAPYGHLEEWAGIRRAFYMAAADDKQWYANNMPAGENPAIRWEDGSLMATGRVIFDALEPVGEGVTVRGTYVDGESAYLNGYAAITETKVGNGRIILLGAQLGREDYIRVLKQIAAECGVYPITEGGDTVINSMLEGEYGQVFTAIESKGVPSFTVAPFNGTDILSGRAFKQGERVEMKPYDCFFVKKD
ncbi:MAG: beta-galactosidase [Clostridia bacterium]|nr:beta-galactosidase [Clostridia bacterium]